MPDDKQQTTTNGTSKSWLRRTAYNVMLAGLSLGICLVLIEVVLRLGLIPNPRHTLLESRGATDDPRARITVVGDSFIYKGGQLDNLLLEHLSANDYAVQNLARPGMNPVDYLFQLKQNAGSFDPDLILFCYYAGNDLSGVIHRSDEQRGTRGWIKTNLYNPMKRFYVVSYLSKIRSIAASRDEAGKMDADSSALAQWGRTHKVNPFFIYAPGRVKKSFVAENLIVDTPHSRSGIPKMRRILSETKSIADRLGARVGIVVFPSTLQVNRSHYPFFEEAGFVTHEETLVESAIQNELAVLADSLDIPLLDLLPVYRARAEIEHYQDYNIHFNETGNRVAADALNSFAVDLLGSGR